jgi:sugar lactone lactonase YvrE
VAFCDILSRAAACSGKKPVQYRCGPKLHWKVCTSFEIPGNDMPTIVDAQVLYRPLNETLKFLPEGPYPLQSDRFSWVAIQHAPDARTGSLCVLDLVTKTNYAYPLPGRPGFAFPTNQPNRFVIGLERSLGIFDTIEKSWTTFCDGVDADVENTIINDGVIFDGNLIFGTKDLEFKTRKAGLYLWRAKDRKLIALRRDQICSNGKAVRKLADGSWQLLDIDSPTKKIVGYTIDIEKGSLSEPTTLVDLTNDIAVPDGMILTPNDQYCIVSMYNPNPAEHGETREYRLSDGKLCRVWRTLGSPQNTCPQLVLHDGKVKLIITTAIEHMPAERRDASPEAGNLFWGETPFQTLSPCPVFPEPN